MSAIPITGPEGIHVETAMPGLARALNPDRAWKEFKRRLPLVSGDGKLLLKGVRVTRHKPGRRCVIEYDLKVDRAGVPRHKITLIGKIRARRSGNEGFRLQRAFWDAGFDGNCADGISVPEPVGVIAAFQMWFQRKVPGATAEEMLGTTDGVPLARRIAEAMHKVHRAGVPTSKTHTMRDELRILRDCLNQVAEQRTAWADRIGRLITASERVGANVRQPVTCGIHRDFYAAQVLVDGSRLWLIDFDLYCEGDPALDAGNFIGHVTEQALRQYGRPDALIEVEQALEERFAQLTGADSRSAVRAYTALTLARHVYLSTKFAERRHLIEQLLDLCESRMLSHRPANSNPAHSFKMRSGTRMARGR